ncbi:MAG: hypothetical protein JWR24_5458 [Actinoallomurus sp.]|jgi:hypothetical protein|nr:hypothetical protein [Actinoallomurus sp.]
MTVHRMGTTMPVTGPGIIVVAWRRAAAPRRITASYRPE